jgi:hypothetical protein
MSRLRADEVLNKAATGPFLATEGINVPTGKNITFNDLSETTVLDGTSLITTDITTTTLTVDQVNLGDNDELKFGDDEDLKLYHNGTDGYIDNYSTGDLRIRSLVDDIFIESGDDIFLNPNGVDNGIKVHGQGSVELYHDDQPKFETTANGVAVTGRISSTTGWAGTTSSANMLGGLSMPFSCGLNGRVALPSTNATMIFGGSEYSGGTDNTEGATMPHDGTVVAATLHAEQAVGNLNLHLIVNGTQDSNYELAFTSPTISNPSVIQTFYSNPKSFSAGDRINFAVNTSTLSQMQVLTVTFFVKFD